MARKGGPIPSKHIAELAGVSAATVSRVMRGSDGVSDHLRQRVMDAVNRSGATAAITDEVWRNSFGLVVSSMRAICPRFLQSFVEEASGGGYLTTVLISDLLERGRRRLTADLLSGLVFQRASDAVAFRRMFASLPAVSLEYDARIEVDQIYPDDYGSGLDITGRIAVTGKVRLALVGEVRKNGQHSPLVQGYIDGALRHDLDLSHDRMCHSGPHRGEARGCATELFHHAKHHPEVVLCTSDEIAIGVLEAASRLSLAIPTDIWVVGHGDSELARIHELTSSSVDHDAWGKQVIQRLTSQESVHSFKSAVRHRVAVRTSAALPELPWQGTTR